MMDSKSLPTRLAEWLIRLVVVVPRGVALAQIALLNAGLGRLTPAALAAINPRLLAQLPPEVLGRFPLEVLLHLPPHVRLQLDDSKLARLRPALLEQVDPTLLPPPVYDKARADAVYGDAFKRCIEYLKFNHMTGPILEFGTFRGYTAGMLARLLYKYDLAEISLHLFDSFEGLPPINSQVDSASYEVQSGLWEHHTMQVGADIPARIQAALRHFLPAERLSVTKGYFEDTLPQHLPAGKALLVHIDCDLYSSTVYVLDYLLKQERLQDGCLLLFDDYNCNRSNPTMGERQALEDAFGAQTRYRYSPFFSYGWHGMAFFIHDSQARRPASA